MREFDPVNPFDILDFELCDGERAEIRLLVVDEEADYFERLLDYAEMCSHEYSVECRHVKRIEEASELIGKWQPSVVIVDAYLGDRDAFAIVDRCRSLSVSVVVSSDNRSPEIEAAAREHGARGYLSKSIDPDDMDFILAYIATLSQVQPAAQ